MPIREHITSQSYIDWLKSMGCVLYLPLLEQGDLTDHITGNALHLTGNGSVNWDNNFNRYLFISPSSANLCVAELDVNLNFPTNEFTTLSNTKRYNTNVKAFWIDTLSQVTSAYNNYNPPLTWCNGFRSNNAVTMDMSGWDTSDEFCFGFSYNNGDRIFYKNGIVKISDYYSYSPSYAQAGTYTKLYLGATTTRVFNGTNRSASIYFSNVMIFNKALTQSQIRQIQQIQ